MSFELCDRLTEEFDQRRFDELTRYLNEKEQFISAEWVGTLFKLREKKEIEWNSLSAPDYFAYAVQETTKMKKIDNLEYLDLDEFNKREIAQFADDARVMYYAHCGIHSMHNRRDRLELSTDILDRHLKSQRAADSFVARQAGNMYEELAFYDMFVGREGINAERAENYNRFVIESVPSWTYAYKLHALMSLLDLEAIKILGITNRTGESPHQGLQKVHTGYNYALEFMCNELITYSKTAKRLNKEIKDEENFAKAEQQRQGNMNMMSGVLAEGLALSVLQDHILKNNMHDRLWARQAFLREDSMASKKINYSETHEEQEKLDIPNFSFDLQIFDYTNVEGEHIPLEVKKRKTPNSNPSQTSLHPDIKVISFKDSTNAEKFARYVKRFATSQIAKFEGKKLSLSQQQSATAVRSRVDPARLFIQA